MVYFRSPFKAQFPVIGNSRQQQFEAAGHNVYITMKQRAKGSVDVLLSVHFRILVNGTIKN